MQDSSPSITFDSTNLYSKNEHDACVKEATIENARAITSAAVGQVESQLQSGEYGFVEVLKDETYLVQVEEVFGRISWAKTLVVIGIGGSDLGARAIKQALENNAPMQVLFHGDSTDPEAIKMLLGSIDLSQTVFNVISKSGQTVETTSQYVFLKKVVQEQTSQWQKHFIFTTDPKEGILRQEADTHGVVTLPIPAGVGGRFSVLTPVGLLPARAMGVDIRTMVEAALAFANNKEQRSLVYEFASTQFYLYQQGIKLVVFMPYSIRLEEFARWFRQLWAESLGKDGKGILPIQARGPADQHSQTQFYNEGEVLQSVLFIRVDNRDTDYKIERVDIDEVAYLKGHTFHEMVNKELEASALSLRKQGRPSGVFAMQDLSAATIGSAFMFFELAVVAVAQMLGVNAFDQPGVEEGKNFMYALLGRDGYQDKMTEIKQLQE